MNATPTGRKRYRVYRPLFGKTVVVLQIEWKGLHTQSIGGHIDSEWLVFWRDARVQDITEEDEAPA